MTFFLGTATLRGTSPNRLRRVLSRKALAGIRERHLGYEPASRLQHGYDSPQKQMYVQHVLDEIIRGHDIKGMIGGKTRP